MGIYDTEKLKAAIESHKMESELIAEAKKFKIDLKAFEINKDKVDENANKPDENANANGKKPDENANGKKPDENANGKKPEDNSAKVAADLISKAIAEAFKKQSENKSDTAPIANIKNY